MRHDQSLSVLTKGMKLRYEKNAPKTLLKTLLRPCLLCYRFTFPSCLLILHSHVTKQSGC